ncbi:hypothetical protein [Variovorax sp. PBL-E5]|uniref:hypothetical protein n=1 Tax=Variovorax sp. PBL-E5 TaxID=434014 RepID=UPI00131672EC|nr:hypothetical protein [Variovorax sp. PBL-E5]VTU30250.1 hypothetical protein E5CHR_02977 [Variovorax sp. PBL-E5]
MALELTERETFAGVLATLVQDRCATSGAARTSRTGLQATVPVDERPSIRRGLNALIEHGVLVMSGEDIGFTAQGKAFAAYVQNAQGERNPKNAATLASTLSAIDKDERFAPHRPIEDIRTLPARLEAYRAVTQPRLSKGWVVLGALATAVAAFALLR